MIRTFMKFHFNYSTNWKYSPSAVVLIAMMNSANICRQKTLSLVVSATEDEAIIFRESLLTQKIGTAGKGRGF